MDCTVLVLLRIQLALLFVFGMIVHYIYLNNQLINFTQICLELTFGHDKKIG